MCQAWIIVDFNSFKPDDDMHTRMYKVSIGPANGLSPGWRQAIILTSTDFLSIGPPWTNFSKVLTNIQPFSIMKMQLEISSEYGGHFASAAYIYIYIYIYCWYNTLLLDTYPLWVRADRLAIKLLRTQKRKSWFG